MSVCSGHFSPSTPILIEYHKIGWFVKNRNLSLKLWKLESPRSRFWQIWCLVRPPFLIHRQSPSHSVLTRQKQEGTPWVLLIQCMRAPPCDLTFSQSSPSEYHHTGVRFQHMNSGGVYIFCLLHGDKIILISWHPGFTSEIHCIPSESNTS